MGCHEVRILELGGEREVLGGEEHIDAAVLTLEIEAVVVSPEHVRVTSH